MWNQLTLDCLPYDLENNVYTSFSCDKEKKKKKTFLLKIEKKISKNDAIFLAS